ncbi:MAG: ribonuclease III [Syntrophobacteraceae bacterium]|jgi:ribonuclease-3|nr:ribonuclease III [Syntrophobacteraceae bacterium]
MEQARSLEKLQDRLGYRFTNQHLLFQALVHRSYVHEGLQESMEDNEILEFLGDSVLNLAISHLLIRIFPEYREGELSRLRSAIVNEKELAHLAQGMSLGEHLYLGRGEEMTGGRQKPSLLADAIEALLASVYLDGGLEAALGVVQHLFKEYLDPAAFDHPLRVLDKDFKTQLQELCQARFKTVPTYLLEGEEGPDHDKTFHACVVLGDRELARGSGKSKKEAQQEAARAALDALQFADDRTP